MKINLTYSVNDIPDIGTTIRSPFRNFQRGRGEERKHRCGHAPKQKSHLSLSLFGYYRPIIFLERREKLSMNFRGIESCEEDGRGKIQVLRSQRERNTWSLVWCTRAARRRNRREACVTPRETLGWRATTEGEAVLTNSSRNGDKERCPSFMKNSVDCELSLSLSAPSCPSLLSRYPYLYILASPFCLRMMIV